jgi:DNA polymerase III subunit gamma/tau
MSLTTPFTARYRPRRFREIRGQGAAVDYLCAQVREGVGHSVLIHGPFGCGVTSLAEVYAQALLCEGTDRPCRECLSCSEFEDEHATHPNYIMLDCASEQDGALLDQITTRTAVESFGAGWLTYQILNAHYLTPRSWDALEVKLRRTPSKTTFILSTRHPEEVPPSVRALLADLRLELISHIEIVGLVRDLAVSEGLHWEEQALELIAERSEGHVSVALADLDRSAATGTVVVRTLLENYGQDARPVLTYLDAVLNGRPLREQLETLESWRATSAKKAELIEAFLTDLFRHDYLKLDRPSAFLTSIVETQRDACVQAVAARTQSAAFNSARGLWLTVLQFWKIDSIPTEPSLVRKAIEFDGLMNRAIADLPVLKPRTGLPRRTSLPPEARVEAAGDDFGRSSLTPSEKRSHLTKSQVEELWTSASFMVQDLGLLLNTQITMAYDKLGVSEPRDVAKLQTDLIRQLRQRAERVIPKNEAILPWLSVYERTPQTGLTSVLTAYVPPQLGPIEPWITRFLTRRFRYVSAPEVVRVDQASPVAAYRRHLDLLRRLSRGLDPTLTIQVSTSEGLQSRRLVEVLGIPSEIRAPIGDVGPLDRVGRAKLIGPAALSSASDS